MPDLNIAIDKVLQSLIWLLPGLLILLVLILAFSYTGRRPKRRGGDDRRPDKHG